MPMIEKIMLRNFKGIKEGSLELAPLTILLGGNNSGKTTILEALFLAPNPFRKVPYKDPSISAIDVIRVFHETLECQDLRFLFYNYVSKDTLISCKMSSGNIHSIAFFNLESRMYAYAIESKHLLTPKDISLLLNKIPDTHENKEWEAILIGHSEDFQKIIVNKEKTFMEGTLLFHPRLINMSWSYIKSVWTLITNLKISTKVARIVSNLVYENYINITLEPFFGSYPILHMLLDNGIRVRLGDIGDGIQILVTAMILYELNKPKVLLWDDIESHMNPKVLLFAAQWIADLLDKGIQVIISTHSIEALRAIAGLVDDKNVKIYLLMLDDGILKSKSLSLKEVEEFWKAGIDIRVGEPFLL